MSILRNGKIVYNIFMKNETMSYWLKAAGIYNLIWGASVVLFPSAQFEYFNMPQPLYPGIWQCVGMIVGVYGLGYWWASRDPFTHWPIIAVGLLGKVLGPIGFIESVVSGKLPLIFGINNIFNDLIWWPSFSLILYGARKKAKAG